MRQLSHQRRSKPYRYCRGCETQHYRPAICQTGYRRPNRHFHGGSNRHFALALPSGRKTAQTLPMPHPGTYTTPATSLADSGTGYSVVVSNDVGTATSSVGILTVTSVPIISTQPAAQTVTAGASATFSVTAAGTAPLSYQWKKGRHGHQRCHHQQLHHTRHQPGRQRHGVFGSGHQ